MQVKELEQKLKELSIKDSDYSLYGELKSDSVILFHNYKKWEVFYLDERGERNQLGVFFEEELACEFLYELLVKANNDRLEEELYKLDSSSPWKGATLKELIQKLKELQLNIKSETPLEILFFQESIILRKENLKWNLYTSYLIYSSRKEILMKTYIFEDTMCSFIYKYCLQKIKFEKRMFTSNENNI